MTAPVAAPDGGRGTALIDSCRTKEASPSQKQLRAGPEEYVIDYDLELAKLEGGGGQQSVRRRR
jgi:hypothetical protein